MTIKKDDEFFLVQKRRDGYWEVTDNSGPYTTSDSRTGLWSVISIPNSHGMVELACCSCCSWYAEVGDLFTTYNKALQECIKRGNWLEKKSKEKNNGRKNSRMATA